MNKSLAFTTLKEVREQSEKIKEELRRRSLEEQLQQKLKEDRKPS